MENRRPFIFLGVGLLNTLLDFLFYSLLVYLFPSNDAIWGIGLISGTFALLCAFTTHKLITWRDHPASKTTLIKFLLVTGFGLWVIRPLLLVWFVTFDGLYGLLHGFASLFAPIPYTFIESTGAFAMMVVIVMTYNYFAYDKIVFKKITDTGRGSDSKS